MPPQSNRGRNNSKVRTVGTRSGQTSAKWSDEHLEYLAAIVVLAHQRKTGMYIGTLTSAGSVKLRFYLDDDACEAVVSYVDDPAECWGSIASEVWDDVAEEVLHRAVAARRAERAQERRGGADLARPSGRGARGAPGASGDATEA